MPPSQRAPQARSPGKPRPARGAAEPAPGGRATGDDRALATVLARIRAAASAGEAVRAGASGLITELGFARVAFASVAGRRSALRGRFACGQGDPGALRKALDLELAAFPLLARLLALSRPLVLSQEALVQAAKRLPAPLTERPACLMAVRVHGHGVGLLYAATAGRDVGALAARFERVVTTLSARLAALTP